MRLNGPKEEPEGFEIARDAASTSDVKARLPNTLSVSFYKAGNGPKAAGMEGIRQIWNDFYRGYKRVMKTFKECKPPEGDSRLCT